MSIQKTSLVLATAVALSSSCGGGSGGAGGNVLMCVAVEPGDALTDDPPEVDEYSVSVHRSSVRTAGPNEQLTPPADFCATSLSTVDLIDENGRHVWFGYGAEQYGEVVDVPALPPLTTASLDIGASWGWGSFTHVEVSENGQLVLALHDGDLMGADGLDVVAESAGLPQLNSCGTETEQRLRFNDVAVDNGASASLDVDGASYTVTNLWSTSFDNWSCEDVPNGAHAAWMAWRN